MISLIMLVAKSYCLLPELMILRMASKRIIEYFLDDYKHYQHYQHYYLILFAKISVAKQPKS